MCNQGLQNNGPTACETVDDYEGAVTAKKIDDDENQVRALCDEEAGATRPDRPPSALGQGGFSKVEEHSGAYSYRIPVHIPPPLNGGPAPRIFITYSSRNTGAPSLIAAGWRLDIGHIERLARRGGKVNFKNNQGSERPTDHFIMNFEGASYTLVCVHNRPNTFRVKLENSFAEAYRILSTQIDPVSNEAEIDSWVVVMADGTKYRFGAPGKAGTDDIAGEVRNKVWNLVSIENPYGHKALFEYEAYRNKNNGVWKEMAYSYPMRIKCGVAPDGLSWDSVVEFIYSQEDVPNSNEGYYNLGIDYTGREREELDGYTCILWKRLTEIQTDFRGADGRFLPGRRLVLTARREDGVFRLEKIDDVAFKNGELDKSAELPPHCFQYYPPKGTKNPALLKSSTSPMNKVDELVYGAASLLDKGQPHNVDDVYLVECYMERVGAETWTKRFEYWDGEVYTPFEEYRGHGRVDVIEVDTQMRTENYYEKNGVHNGCIREQKWHDTKGRLIKHLLNYWMALDYHGGRYMPFIQNEVIRHYAEDGTTALFTVAKQIPKAGTADSSRYCIDRYGNALEKIESFFEGDMSPGKDPCLEKKTITGYLNIDEGENRFIGFPLDVKEFARTKEFPEWILTAWTSYTYNDKGQQTEQRTHVERADAGKVFKITAEYHPITGKKMREFRWDGAQMLVVKERTFYENGPYQFLENRIVNAKGHVEKIEEYDLQFRSPSLVIKPDGIAEKTSFDGLGRTTEEVFASRNPDSRDGSKDSARYLYTVTAGERSIETVFLETGRRIKEYYDPFNRKYKCTETGYRGKLIVCEQIEYDHKTRKPVRIAEPHFDGATPPGFQIFEYDDPRLRRTMERDAGGRVRRFLYDGLKETTIEEVFAPSDTGNDVLLRTRVMNETTKNALNQVTRRAEGRPEADARYEVDFCYDAAGRLAKATDSLGVTLKTIEYGNRLDTRPVAVQDAGLGKSRMEYDNLGRLIATYSDFTGSMDRVLKITYDELDRVIKQTDRNISTGATRTILNTYDTALNGVGRLALQDATETGSIGRYQHIKRFEYNEFCQVRAIGQEWRVFWQKINIERALTYKTLYVHNGQKGGRLERVEHAATGNFSGSVTEYLYDDASGLLEEIRYNEQPVWKVRDGNFTARNQPAAILLGNGLVNTDNYDERTGRLAARCAKRGDTVLLDYQLHYDSSGNVRKCSGNVRLPVGQGGEETWSTASSYEYDEKNQLIVAREDNNEQKYTYKANGSLARRIDRGNEIIYTYQETHPHRVAALSGHLERTISYDEAGNLTRDVNQKTRCRRQLEWNPSNRLARVVFLTDSPEQKHQLCFGYDAKNKRAVAYNSFRDELTFYGDDVIELSRQMASGNVVVRVNILHGTRRVATVEYKNQSVQFRYYHRDGVNSVVSVTDAAGNPASAIVYTPFGGVTARAGDYSPNVLFTGHRCDIIDYEGFAHYDFLARIYDPHLGMFISPDPTDDDKNAAFGFNRYVYVGNNPVSKWDPTGMENGDDEEKRRVPGIDIELGFGVKDAFGKVMSGVDLFINYNITRNEFSVGGSLEGLEPMSKTFSELKGMFSSGKNDSSPFAWHDRNDQDYKIFDQIFKDNLGKLELPTPSYFADFLKFSANQPKIYEQKGTNEETVRQIQTSRVESHIRTREMVESARQMGFKDEDMYDTSGRMRKEVVRQIDKGLYESMNKRGFWND